MKNRIVKYGILLVGLCLLVGISVAVYMFNKPKRNIAKTKAEYSLSATQLLTEFTQNEQTANAKYLSAAYGKVIQVTGVIGEIDQKGDTACNLSLKEPAMHSGSINCSIEKTEIPNVKSLKVGDKIAVKGECTGYLDITNEVSMVNCLVEQ